MYIDQLQVHTGDKNSTSVLKLKTALTKKDLNYTYRQTKQGI